MSRVLKDANHVESPESTADPRSVLQYVCQAIGVMLLLIQLFSQHMDGMVAHLFNTSKSFIDVAHVWEQLDPMYQFGIQLCACVVCYLIFRCFWSKTKTPMVSEIASQLMEDRRQVIVRAVEPLPRYFFLAVLAVFILQTVTFCRQGKMEMAYLTAGRAIGGPLFPGIIYGFCKRKFLFTDGWYIILCRAVYFIVCGSTCKLWLSPDSEAIYVVKSISILNPFSQTVLSILFIENVIDHIFCAIMMALFAVHMVDENHAVIYGIAIISIFAAIIKHEYLSARLHAHVEKSSFNNLRRWIAQSSHDLGGPLIALVLRTELLESMFSVDKLQSSASLEEHLRCLQMCISSINAQRNNIVEQGQVQLGTMPAPNKHPCNLRDVATAVVNMSQDRARRARSQIRLEISPKVASVIITDEGWLTRMLLNLVANGVTHAKHMVGLILVAPTMPINQTTNKKGSSNKMPMLRVEVHDDGDGVPDSLLPHLFKMYNCGQKRNGGTGIGLASVKIQAKALGGQCGYAQSKMWGGAMFWFEIPYILTDETTAKLDEHEDTMMCHKKASLSLEKAGEMKLYQAVGDKVGSVCLVDDVQIVRDTIATYLSYNGYQTTTAWTMESALALLEEREFTIVLCDVQMQNLNDGYRLVEEFRRWEKQQVNRPHQPIVIMSCVPSDEEHLDQVQRAGADGFLQKSFENKDLLRTIRKYGRMHYNIGAIDADEVEDKVETNRLRRRRTQLNTKELKLEEQISDDTTTHGKHKIVGVNLREQGWKTCVLNVTPWLWPVAILIFVQQCIRTYQWYGKRISSWPIIMTGTVPIPAIFVFAPWRTFAWRNGVYFTRFVTCMLPIFMVLCVWNYLPIHDADQLQQIDRSKISGAIGCAILQCLFIDSIAEHLALTAWISLIPMNIGSKVNMNIGVFIIAVLSILAAGVKCIYLYPGLYPEKRQQPSPKKKTERWRQGVVAMGQNCCWLFLTAVVIHSMKICSLYKSGYMVAATMQCIHLVTGPLLSVWICGPWRTIKFQDGIYAMRLRCGICPIIMLLIHIWMSPDISETKANANIAMIYSLAYMASAYMVIESPTEYVVLTAWQCFTTAYTIRATDMQSMIYIIFSFSVILGTKRCYFHIERTVSANHFSLIKMVILALAYSLLLPIIWMDVLESGTRSVQETLGHLYMRLYELDSMEKLVFRTTVLFLLYATHMAVPTIFYNSAQNQEKRTAIKKQLVEKQRGASMYIAKLFLWNAYGGAIMCLLDAYNHIQNKRKIAVIYACACVCLGFLPYVIIFGRKTQPPKFIHGVYYVRYRLVLFSVIMLCIGWYNEFYERTGEMDIIISNRHTTLGLVTQNLIFLIMFVEHVADYIFIILWVASCALYTGADEIQVYCSVVISVGLAIIKYVYFAVNIDPGIARIRVAALRRWTSHVANRLGSELEIVAEGVEELEKQSLKTEDAFKMVKRAANNMAIIHRMSMVDHHVWHGQPLKPSQQTCCLKDLTKRIKAVQRESDQVEISMHFDDALMPDIITDPHWLEGMIIRLISNATRYAKSKISVHWRINPNSTMLRVEVHDDGNGVSLAVKPYLFQIHTTDLEKQSSYIKRSTPTNTAGIGLACVREMCRVIGGCCGYGDNSVELGGAMFWFEIPYRPDDTATTMVSDNAAKSPQKVQKSLGRVLVVEDCQMLRNSYVKLFGQYGLTVDVAVDGYDGLAMTNRRHYDLVLSDINMPGKDGYEMTKGIRQRESSCPTTYQIAEHLIVMVSANELESDRKHAFVCGADGFVAKPFKIKDLLRELDKHLQTERPDSMSCTYESARKIRDAIAPQVLLEQEQATSKKSKEQVSKHIQQIEMILPKLKHDAPESACAGKSKGAERMVINVAALEESGCTLDAVVNALPYSMESLEKLEELVYGSDASMEMLLNEQAHVLAHQLKNVAIFMYMERATIQASALETMLKTPEPNTTLQTVINATSLLRQECDIAVAALEKYSLALQIAQRAVGPRLLAPRNSFRSVG